MISPIKSFENKIYIERPCWFNWNDYVYKFLLSKSDQFNFIQYHDLYRIMGNKFSMLKCDIKLVLADLRYSKKIRIEKRGIRVL